MAYSIQYGTSVKRKKRRSYRQFWALALLLLAIFGRILAHSHLEPVQKALLGEAEAVAAFYEDFVKHELGG